MIHDQASTEAEETESCNNSSIVIKCRFLKTEKSDNKNKSQMVISMMANCTCVYKVISLQSPSDITAPMKKNLYDESCRN